MECWTDLGFRDVELFYIRDRKKREVDFLITRDKSPWFIAEVKNSDEALSGNLPLFQKATGAKHAFQVVLNADYDGQDCFKKTIPSIVSAKTFLSQLA